MSASQKQPGLEEKKKSFDEEVERRLQVLQDSFESGLNKTYDPEKYIRDELQRLKSIFEDYIMVEKIPAQERRTIVAATKGSIYEDENLPIKIIYYQRINAGFTYNYRDIVLEPGEDIINIQVMLADYNKIGNYYLENQVNTEVYYGYYKYLLNFIEDEITGSQYEILSITEKLLILQYLQDLKLFPRITAKIDSKAYYQFLGALFNNTDENIKKRYSSASETKRADGLTKSQIAQRIKSLQNIQPVIDKLGIKVLSQTVEKRIIELTEIFDN